MARMTTQELHQAKRLREEERQREREEGLRRRQKEEEREREAEAAREATLAPLRARLASLEANRNRAEQLESVVAGLYGEMDKLCKKSPADEVTELAMNRVNSAIGRCKELMAGDEFIDSIDLFVPAGERPEQRDVLLVLGELRQGIRRLSAEREHLRKRSREEKWDGERAEGKDDSIDELLRGFREL